MSRAKGIRKQVVGKTKETVGEIAGDQQLQDEGKAEEQRGREEQDQSGPLNPFKKLDQLT